MDGVVPAVLFFQGTGIFRITSADSMACGFLRISGSFFAPLHAGSPGPAPAGHSQPERRTTLTTDSKTVSQKDHGLGTLVFRGEGPHGARPLSPDDLAALRQI